MLQRAIQHYFEAEKDAKDDGELLHIPTIMADFARVELDRELKALRERETLLLYLTQPV